LSWEYGREKAREKWKGCIKLRLEREGFQLRQLGGGRRKIGGSKGISLELGMEQLIGFWDRKPGWVKLGGQD